MDAAVGRRTGPFLGGPRGLTRTEVVDAAAWQWPGPSLSVLFFFPQENMSTWKGKQKRSVARFSFYREMCQNDFGLKLPINFFVSRFFLCWP